MKLKTSEQRPKNCHNTFPANRDFYLFDKEENIKDFKKTDMNDLEYIFVITENEKKEIHENIYKRKDFMSNYDFVKIETKNPEVYINCLIPKINFNIGREARLLVEIKKRPLFIKEIYGRTKINLNTKKVIVFKEVFNIPTEKRFFNKIFTLNFYEDNLIKSQNKQPQIINDNNNIYNNNFNNNESIRLNNFDNDGYNNNFQACDDNNRFINNFNINNNFNDFFKQGNFQKYDDSSNQGIPDNKSNNVNQNYIINQNCDNQNNNNQNYAKNNFI